MYTYDCYNQFYFIILHFSTFKDLLSANHVFCENEKTSYVVYLYFIVSVNWNVLLWCIPRQVWKVIALSRNSVGGWDQNKKTVETAVYVTHEVFNTWKTWFCDILKGGWVSWDYWLKLQILTEKCAPQNGCLLSVLWCLLVIVLLLLSSIYAIYRMRHHDIWTRASNFL